MLFNVNWYKQVYSQSWISMYIAKPIYSEQIIHPTRVYEAHPSSQSCTWHWRFPPPDPGADVASRLDCACSGGLGITVVPPTCLTHLSVSFRVCEDLTTSALQKHHTCVLRICLLCYLPRIMGFLGDSYSKEFACNARDPCLIPKSGSSPGERNGNSLQYSLPG